MIINVQLMRSLRCSEGAYMPGKVQTET